MLQERTVLNHEELEFSAVAFSVRPNSIIKDGASCHGVWATCRHEICSLIHVLSRVPELALMSASIPVRAGFFLLYWAASFCLWLLFVDTTREHELWLAAAASVVAASGAEVVRAQPFADFRPRLVWLLQAWREPWYILEGCTTIFWVFLKHFIHPEPSVLREVVYDPGGSEPADAARRALAITYTTVPPNFVVLGIDFDKRVMLVHQVIESETPTMTRNLGARS